MILPIASVADTRTRYIQTVYGVVTLKTTTETQAKHDVDVMGLCRCLWQQRVYN